MFPAARYHPNAKVLCGKGTLNWAASESWPGESNGTFDGHIWDPSIAELPIEEFDSPSEAPKKWQKLGPFPNAHDFFGDGSFWVIDAPGHCPGNLAALARFKTKNGKAKWAFLGGDCFHCMHFVHHPEAPFGKGVKFVKTGTFHEEQEPAREMIRQIAELKRGEGDGALVWFAHADTLEGIWEI
jgi:glyoxylase-like metal-dependent hydrolase (beta-lactamase superfamily II)